MTTSERKSVTPEFIVGIGTSAGGLEALEHFFTNMPHYEELAFLVVQHLSPDYKSHMVELLTKYTPMPVHEAQDGITVNGGNVYLLPPRKNMTIYQGTLYLVDYDRKNGLNLPIDILLESLAKDQKEHAIACILSGTGSDGTRGIRAIKEHGGMVLVQDESAKFDGMPKSAISTNVVDYIAPATEMPEILTRYVANPTPIHADALKLQHFNQKDHLGKVLAILRDNNGVDFTGYKPNTLMRRIERRVTLFEITELEDYIRYLQQSENERKTLVNEFLIGVTSFFRDQEAFNFLQSHVIPNIMQDRARRDQIRIWVPGCSTGDEPYSIAMLFQDYMERIGHFFDVKIFATDIDREALNRASAGFFTESVLADVPSDFLGNYFIKSGDGYEVSRQIRTMVVFAYQNLITDPPFSRIDLVSCRNLLIYFQSDIQERVLANFEFALRSGGYLFLGSSESIGDRSADFVDVSSKWKMYRYHGNFDLLKNMNVPRPSEIQTNTSMRVKERMPYPKISQDWRASDAVLRSLVENILPPCIVIDQNMQLVHAFGDVSPYMTAPRGYQVTLNVMNMVSPELAMPLSTALHRTFNKDKAVNYGHIQMEVGGELRYVEITTRIFWERNKNQQLAIVLFTHSALEDPKRPNEVYTINDGINQRIEDLEQELQFTRMNLQSTIEELETSNEELQATNEELMAANEEMQSTNEELESVNEELITVNNEYQIKIRELSALNDDMNNLLKNINIGTIFLDADLKVRKFTPDAQQSINLLEQDIGRPIDHFDHKFVDFDLPSTIHTVLETLITQSHEVQNKVGRWMLVRIAPYRTHANQINGVVLTMVDITELKLASQMAIESSEFSQVVLNSLSAQIAVLDSNGVIVTVNHAWQQFAIENGGSREHTDVGANYLDICRSAAGLNAQGSKDVYVGLQDLLEGRIEYFDYEYPCHAPHEERWFLLRAVPLVTDKRQVVVSHINISAQKRVEQQLLHHEQRLQLALMGTSSTIFEHDLTLRYVWLQHGIIKYPPPDALNKVDTDFLPEDEAGTLLYLKHQCLKQKQLIQETVSLTINEKVIECDVILKPILDENQVVKGLFGIYTP